MCSNIQKHEMAILRVEMDQKLRVLRAKEAELSENLSTGYNEDVFRQLNIIRHRIEVSEIRREGWWLNGDYPGLTPLPVRFK